MSKFSLDCHCHALRGLTKCCIIEMGVAIGGGCPPVATQAAPQSACPAQCSHGPGVGVTETRRPQVGRGSRRNLRLIRRRQWLIPRRLGTFFPRIWRIAYNCGAGIATAAQRAGDDAFGG